MSLSIWFNSTVLVFWALGLVPYAMRTRQYWILLVSGLVLIPVEIFLTWDKREYPDNIFAALFIFFWALFLGVLTCFYNKRKKEKSNERVD